MDIKRIMIGGAVALAGVATLTAATTATQQSALPAGMVSFFDRNCPSGWNDVSSNWRGRYIVVGDRVGSTVGTALGANENRPTGDHTHGAPVSFYGGSCPTNPTGNCVRWAEAGAGRGPRQVGGVVALNQDETVVAGTNAPYVTLKACVKR
jgi:hypothetical protein